MARDDMLAGLFEKMCLRISKQVKDSNQPVKQQVLVRMVGFVCSRLS